MTESKQIFIRTIQLGILIFGIWILVNFNRQTTNLAPVEQNHPDHLIKQNAHFKPLWNSDGFVSCHTCLQADSHAAVLLGNLSGRRKVDLIRFDVNTKTVQWRKEINGFGPMWIDDNYIYTARGGKARVYHESQRIGTASVTARDLLTGNVVWSNTVYGARGIPFLSSDGQVVSAVGQQYINLTHMDAETGERIGMNEILVPVIYADETITLTYRWFFRGGRLTALDTDSGEILWQDDIQIGTFAVEEGILVVNSTRGEGIGEVKAIDLATGEVKWRYEGVVSNLAVDNSKVYFLRIPEANEWGESFPATGIIPVIDLHSGKQITTLNFIPEMIKPLGGMNPYYVFALDDIVVVYFGDSGQLFALEFIPPQKEM